MKINWFKKSKIIRYHFLKVNEIDVQFLRKDFKLFPYVDEKDFKKASYITGLDFRDTFIEILTYEA